MFLNKIFSFIIVMASEHVLGYPHSAVNKTDYPFPYYTHADWSSQPTPEFTPIKTPTPYVVIHHTYIPPACYNTEECKHAMRSMQEYHKSLGWEDIGYNFCIGAEGSAYEGRGWNAIGIHTGKANNYSIGICLIGDWRTKTPPPKQLETTKALIEVGVKSGVISPQYKLIGHRQVMSTECPGNALYKLITTWNHYVPRFEIPMKED